VIASFEFSGTNAIEWPDWDLHAALPKKRLLHLQTHFEYSCSCIGCAYTAVNCCAIRTSAESVEKVWIEDIRMRQSKLTNSGIGIAKMVKNFELSSLQIIQ